MPRGGRRHGYDWGVSDKDFTSVKIPKEIAAEVKESAHKIWEKRKEEQNDDDRKETIEDN